MIQDIAPHHLFNQYQPEKKCQPDDLLICAQEGRLLVSCARELRFPHARDIGPQAAEPCYLFSLDAQDFYLAREEVPAPAGYAYETLRTIRKEKTGGHAAFFAAYTAAHLVTFYAHNHFCGSCGARTRHSETERALVCPQCGRIIYPQLIPAIIAGVIDGDRILLTKYANRDVPFYALIAGFTEIGETFEECVHREVYEEVGLHVKNLRYYKSQPWGNVQDILAGFFCEVDGSREIHRQQDELKEALWVPRESIELQPDDFSLTNEMMQLFKEGREPALS